MALDNILQIPRQVIEVHKRDEVHLVLNVDKGTARDLYEYFSFEVPNHFHMPKFRAGVWDGKIHLFSLRDGSLPVGLYHKLVDFATEYDYDLKLHFNRPKPKYTREQVETFMDEGLMPCASGERIVPHDFQVDSVLNCVNEQRSLLLSPTSSGKSLIIYSLARWYLDVERHKRVLIMVPTTALVEQMTTDFADYATEEEWPVFDKVHRIYSGKEKITEKPIVVTTWHSVYKLHDGWFSQFDSVIVDECHTAKGPSITSALNKMKGCKFRVGTTGTLDGTQVNRLTIEGLFGKVYQVVTTKELMDRDIVSQMKIECLRLVHADRDKLSIMGSKNDDQRKKLVYKTELDYLCKHDRRNKFIVNLAKSCEGNTLVLFNFIDHGKQIYNDLLAACPDRKIFMVYGKVAVDDREMIRLIVAKEKNATVVASYGTFQTGTNIPTLEHVILASPTKSQIRLLQSIGRGLRRTKTITHVTLYDVLDDLRYDGRMNFGMIHFFARAKIYKAEGFKYSVNEIPLKERTLTP